MPHRGRHHRAIITGVMAADDHHTRRLAARRPSAITEIVADDIRHQDVREK